MSYRRRKLPHDFSGTGQKGTPESQVYKSAGSERVLNTGILYSGLSYQRPVNQRDVEKLVRDWSDALFEPPIVSHRGGKYYLVDGQRRVSAIRKMNGGKDANVTCRVFCGILFDRPAFQAMMSDISAGTVNCVIVKDLSRLGREYIETGRYLRNVFPSFGVRFISINDGVDTANERTGDDLNISMKNIINDAYCHDISVKTRSALEVKRKNGDYVGACPVYGYRKSPENHNQLVVDEETAHIVREIYRRKLEGESAQRIAEELNRLGVLSPLAYKIDRGLPHPILL